MADEASLDPEPQYFSERDLRKIARDVAHGTYIRRGEANALTGEWTVFAVHEGKNYCPTMFASFAADLSPVEFERRYAQSGS